MRIGILGSGSVGGTLGVRWSQIGHEVVFGTRELMSEKMATLLLRAHTGARVATMAATAASCDVLVLATPWSVTEQVLRGCGSLRDKIILDATNPLPQGLTAPDKMGRPLSGGESVAIWAPGASVIKALNTVGYNVMENPNFEPGRPAMLYCGDGEEAKVIAARLITELGFDAFDVGPLDQSHLLESMAFLWIRLALKQGLGREFVFQLVRR